LYTHKFKKIGFHSKVARPLLIKNGHYISIGDNCLIYKGLRIEAVNEYAGVKLNPTIKIGNNVDIGQCCHIIASESVSIGNNVSLGPFVMINDSNHGFKDKSVPVKQQPLTHKRIIIDDDSWIGSGACILPGVHIGKHCVIGANVVVKHDVKDYSIVLPVEHYEHVDIRGKL
jgi:acetyltransferase-like isoleucine patch superfamily enzyme